MSEIARDIQSNIFIRGLSGASPELPLEFEALEAAAREKMSPEAFAYVAGGAGRESTIDKNSRDFDDFSLVPKMLKGYQSVDTSIELLDRKYSTPFLLSPIGVLSMAHPKADLAVAKAASETAVPMIFSNQASVPMEDCAAVMGDQDRWFQLYYSQEKGLVKSLLERAEKAGCSAIVVTLDTTRLGWRPRDLELAYLPFLRGMGIAQYTSDPVFQKMLDEGRGQALKDAPQPSINLNTLSAIWQQKSNYPAPWTKKLFSDRPMRAVRLFINTYSRPDLSWDDLPFIRECTKLPVILKGIVHPDDAEKAKDQGMDGIIVSNHGGRQVDGAISTVKMLPKIMERVGTDFPVIFDSGIRSGAHALKALSLGAKAVCIGRPFVYALALNGKKGVKDLLNYYRASLELNMSLAGCKKISDLGPQLFESYL
jgi:lactate 2-monooxygenase